MPQVRPGPLRALPPGTVAEWKSGNATYAICNVDGRLHCVEGICPHAGGPLAQGNLIGPLLVCPWHGWEFDCRTGRTDFDGRLRLKTFPVRVENDEILIDIS